MVRRPSANERREKADNYERIKHWMHDCALVESFGGNVAYMEMYSDRARDCTMLEQVGQTMNSSLVFSRKALQKQSLEKVAEYGAIQTLDNEGAVKREYATRIGTKNVPMVDTLQSLNCREFLLHSRKSSACKRESQSRGLRWKVWTSFRTDEKQHTGDLRV
jgi:hypothetical protein